jgi:hypothetical protein|tara:strand:+ start:459 stop:1043 length:585 start_codon:yes stop_codon:yes gene_type:complete
MGTRSHTHFQDREGTILATMYRQYDGYPRGHGMDIYRYFMDEELDRTFFPNGYPIGNFHGANGMGDSALQFMAHLKTYNHPIVLKERNDGGTYLTEDRMVEADYEAPRIGNYYLTEPGLTMDDASYLDYEYTFYINPDLKLKKGGPIRVDEALDTGDVYCMKIRSSYDEDNDDGIIFDGTLNEFKTWFDEEWND